MKREAIGRKRQYQMREKIPSKTVEIRYNGGAGQDSIRGEIAVDTNKLEVREGGPQISVIVGRSETKI